MGCIRKTVAVVVVLLAGALTLAGCNGFFINTSTTTTLTSSGTNVVYESSVTLTAKVVSSAATGTVEFFDGSTELGSGTLTDGIATYTTTALTEGTHSLIAEYEGDDTYSSSSSPAITVVVSASLTATTTTLTASATSQASGLAEVLTATMSPTSATGTVEFFDGSTEIGTGTVSSSGVATFSTSALAVGSHTLTATYEGDSSDASSTSGAVTVTITSATS